MRTAFGLQSVNPLYTTATLTFTEYYNGIGQQLCISLTSCSNSGAYLQGVQIPYNSDYASVSLAEYYNEVREHL